MKKDVVVLNCGSSSVKFAIIDATSGEAQMTGLAESLGNQDASVTVKYKGDKQKIALSENAMHAEALEEISRIIAKTGVEPVAVGHRVVHGGEKFKQAVQIDESVEQAIQECAAMAPLHNPANLTGILTAKTAYPSLPHVAVFDTAFFQSMPQHAYLYALPRALYRDHAIRRYGFHGTSHKYILDTTASELNKSADETTIISAHLGNGCSVTAVAKGKAVDTSLGFTPLEGLVMGTRCGDIDPSLPTVLQQKLGKNAEEINKLLNTESGLLGISELSNDCRALEEAAEQGHEGAIIALEIFCYRLAKYIGGYMVATPDLDAIVFTGGIGENSSLIREKTLGYFTHLGVNLDTDKNLDKRFGAQGEITAADSPIACWVIPTNEEWVIAQQAAQFA